MRNTKGMPARGRPARIALRSWRRATAWVLLGLLLIAGAAAAWLLG